MSTLYKKVNYLINAVFLKSVLITEYDISKANISILLDKGLITKDQYNYLYRLPKIDREVFVGNMIRHDPTKKTIYNAIKSGIITAKQNLFLQNNVQDPEVIRIANDAVFIMRNSLLTKTKFGVIEFKQKKQYSIFARVGGLSIFYGSKMGDIDLDVLGLGKDQTLLHADYMLTFIGNLFYLIESSTLSHVMEYYLVFYQKYLKRELEPGFYRELNEASLFTVPAPRGNGKFGMMFTNEISKIDISYNAGILRELYGIITSSDLSN